MSVIYCLTPSCENNLDGRCTKYEESVPINGMMCEGYKEKEPESGIILEKQNNVGYVEDLINKLLSVNSITGIASIIDLCKNAADYIMEAEKLRDQCLRQNDMFERYIYRKDQNS